MRGDALYRRVHVSGWRIRGAVYMDHEIVLSPVKVRTHQGIPVCPGCLWPDVTCDEPNANGLCLGCRSGVHEDESETVN